MLIVTFNDTILTNQLIDLIDLLSCSLKERQMRISSCQNRSSVK